MHASLIAALLSFSADAPVDFTRDVRPILAQNCFACHGPDEAKPKARLRLDTQEGPTGKARPGYAAVAPGDPAKSELITRITSDIESKVMPPAKLGKALKPAEVDVLRRWIKQGANFPQHWAWVKPI